MRVKKSNFYSFLTAHLKRLSLINEYYVAELGLQLRSNQDLFEDLKCVSMVNEKGNYFLTLRARSAILVGPF